MTRIAGPTLEQLDTLGDDYAGLLARTLAVVAAEVVATPPDDLSVEDLSVLRAWWAEEVDAILLPALGVAFEVGAAQVRVGLREAVGLTAAAWTDDVPTLQDALAEAYLAQARNRLVGVGDELWAHAREELLEGMRLGEGVDELAARIVGVPGMTEARASVVARTEVNGATNAGAMAQVRAAGVTGSKEWIATDDERVRPTHHLADFAKVRLDEQFTVGGFPMDRPHDPSGPPQETVNCRCTLGFDLDLEDVEVVTGNSGGPAGLPTGPPTTTREDERDTPQADDSPGVRQRQDRSFLERVFARGLAFMARLLQGRTAAADTITQANESGGEDMTVTAAVDPASPVPSADGAWEGVLVVEGSPTGDGRQFSQGALTWAELPLPLKWQEREDAGHNGAVIVGRIDSIERQGNQIIGRGVFDLDGAHGQEAHRLVAGRFLRGVSIAPDDIGSSDVEYIFPNEVSVVDETGDDDAGQAIMDLLGRPELEVYHAGRIRSATLAAEAAFVEAEVRLTNAPIQEAVMVAALDEYRPPAKFFTRCLDPIPTVTTPDGRVFRPALGVSDDRRVWGYAAQWEECHIGFPGVCTSPPQEDDFAHYLLGEVLCAGGERVPVGQITMATGHASTDPRVSARAAAEHYDHTGAVVADVVVGADDHGIWLSGAVRPGADLTAFRAAGAVSGDWRRINGALRLVALLTVNVPGFQQVRARVASGVQTALVAAGQVGWQEVAQPDLRPVAERIAASISRDRASRRQAAAERVHATVWGDRYGMRMQ